MKDIFKSILGVSLGVIYLLISILIVWSASGCGPNDGLCGIQLILPVFGIQSSDLITLYEAPYLDSNGELVVPTGVTFTYWTVVAIFFVIIYFIGYGIESLIKKIKSKKGQF